MSRDTALSRRTLLRNLGAATALAALPRAAAGQQALTLPSIVVNQQGDAGRIPTGCPDRGVPPRFAPTLRARAAAATVEVKTPGLEGSGLYCTYAGRSFVIGAAHVVRGASREGNPRIVVAKDASTAPATLKLAVMDECTRHRAGAFEILICEVAPGALPHAVPVPLEPTLDHLDAMKRGDFMTGNAFAFGYPAPYGFVEAHAAVTLSHGGNGMFRYMMQEWTSPSPEVPENELAVNGGFSGGPLFFQDDGGLSLLVGGFVMTSPPRVLNCPIYVSSPVERCAKADYATPSAYVLPVLRLMVEYERSYGPLPAPRGDVACHGMEMVWPSTLPGGFVDQLVDTLEKPGWPHRLPAKVVDALHGRFSPLPRETVERIPLPDRCPGPDPQVVAKPLSLPNGYSLINAPKLPFGR